MNPWAAATRHPWRGAANPASCRVTHGIQALRSASVFDGAPEIKIKSQSNSNKRKDQAVV
ncbi:hypothetical protein [Pseudomonas lactucae]|uniref:Uncharacterized protein n=1 Tax=Pseudomonas lactucae TaxID=2813360 RepID=A0A9X0YFR7_9PSED|nr:hypothetical protein [Pseudomonas lactucae]MBN2979017.1 hypothetical protein [Pseudomonas lactucae]